MSKVHTDIDLFILYFEYVEFYHSNRELLPFKIIIKEVIDNLGIYCEKLKFVSISTVY